MANLTKIVECATQQAFDNIAQKDETVLYLTPENTISIQAGNGIEVEKTTDAEGNEIYTVGIVAPPPSNFATAYNENFNFNGKTITFTAADYSGNDSDGNYKITFANGYYIRINAGGGMGVWIYDPYSQGETNIIAGYFESPVTYTFRDGQYDVGADCTVTGFYRDSNYGDSYSEITAEQFAERITLTFTVEE